MYANKSQSTRQSTPTKKTQSTRNQQTSPPPLFSAPETRPKSRGNGEASGLLTGVFMTLIPELQKALKAQSYMHPTPIQEQSIEHLLQGRDLLGCAQTGTGKTAAFALPLLQHLHGRNMRPKPGAPRALIMAPTRELAAQVAESIAVYSRFLPVSQTTIFGGVGQNPQVRALRQGVDIVVATPGRLLDLLNQGVLELNRVEAFVLDEADRMLDMGFLPDIRRIMKLLPAKRQSLLFSATFPRTIADLANEVVQDPVRVSIAPEQPEVETIDQQVLFVEKQDKVGLLTDLLRDEAKQKILVFAEMKHIANRISQQLKAAGIAAAAIHGNKSQKARTEALSQFKDGTVRVLVATDIAARGLDVTGISHVINFNLPREAETYIHRIGRTARAGAAGDAVSFCSAEERGLLGRIERLLRHKVPVGGRPSRKKKGSSGHPTPVFFRKEARVQS